MRAGLGAAARRYDDFPAIGLRRSWRATHTWISARNEAVTGTGVRAIMLPRRAARDGLTARMERLKIDASLSGWTSLRIRDGRQLHRRPHPQRLEDHLGDLGLEDRRQAPGCAP
jgi:hypothetical protein